MDRVTEQHLQRQILELVVGSGGDGLTSAELSGRVNIIGPLHASTLVGRLLGRGLVEYRRRDDRKLFVRAGSLVYVPTLAGIDMVQRG